MRVLAAEGLTVRFGGRAVLRNLTLAVAAGESYGLVGESGSGKTTLALAAMGALGAGARLEGRVRLAPPPPGGAAAAMVHQEPAAALNPVRTLGAQLAEAAGVWRPAPRRALLAEAAEMLARVGLADPGAMLRRYPHEVSGGQAQRAVIAMALLARPRLLLLDEPTTGLDATVERRVVDLIVGLAAEAERGMLYISHNLGLIARVAGRIGVLYAGDLVEEGPAAAILSAPRHPYTRALLACLPRVAGPRPARLAALPGQLPGAEGRGAGCAFAPRCPAARPGLCDAGGVPDLVPVAPDHAVRCRRLEAVPAGPVAPVPPRAAAPAPALAEPPARPGPDAPAGRAAAPAARHGPGAPLLAVRGLARLYPGRGGGPAVPALRGVDLDIAAGEVVGLVGESGSGKSTLARVLVGLDAAEGTARLGAADLARLPARRRPPAVIRAVQMVFQNPDATLNPAHSVRRTLTRALRRLGCPRSAVAERIAALMAAVRLPAELADLRPEALSGGQKQRVAIARALAGAPALVLADEPTSALDVSVQAAVANLLADLRAERGMALLFISHDLALVRHLSDRIVVLLAGRVMEEGPAEALFAAPLHPYTRMLLAAHHPPDPAHVPPPLPAEAPAAATGCPFRTACPHARAACTADPPVRRLADRRFACHLTPAELEESP